MTRFAKFEEQAASYLRGLHLATSPQPAEPYVLPLSTARAVTNAAPRLVRLLKQAVYNSGINRAERLAALDSSTDDYPLFMVDDHQEWQNCDVIMRPDVIVSEGRPWFLEFNVSSAVGGVDVTHQLALFWRSLLPEIVNQSVHPSPGEARARYFRDVYDAGEVAATVPIVGSTEDHGGERTMEIERNCLARVGLNAEILQPDDLAALSGGSGQQLEHLGPGLKYMTVQEWRELEIPLDPLADLITDRRLDLRTSQTASLLSNKRVMAWLSEGQDWMTASDRHLVDSFVPWTRVLRNAPSVWRGRHIELPDLVSSRREAMVIKRNIGMKSEGVTIGRLTAAAEWDELVEKSLSRMDAVVQEYRVTDPYELEMWVAKGERVRQVTRPLYGPFFCGRHFGGFGVRFTIGHGEQSISAGKGAFVSSAMTSASVDRSSLRSLT